MRVSAVGAREAWGEFLSRTRAANEDAPQICGNLAESCPSTVSRIPSVMADPRPKTYASNSPQSRSPQALIQTRNKG